MYEPPCICLTALSVESKYAVARFVATSSRNTRSLHHGSLAFTFLLLPCGMAGISDPGLMGLWAVEMRIESHIVDTIW